MFCSKMIKTTSTRKATGDKYPNSTSTLSTSSSTFFASTSITDSYRSSQLLDDDSRRTSNDTTKSVRWDTRTAADKVNDNDAEFSELFYSAYSSNRKKNSHRTRTAKSSGTIHSNSNSSNNNTTSDSATNTKPLAGAARRIRSYIANQKFGTRKSNSSNIDDDDNKKKRDIELDETKRDSSRMESSTDQ